MYHSFVRTFRSVLLRSSSIQLPTIFRSTSGRSRSRTGATQSPCRPSRSGAARSRHKTGSRAACHRAPDRSGRPICRTRRALPQSLQLHGIRVPNMLLARSLPARGIRNNTNVPRALPPSLLQKAAYDDVLQFVFTKHDYLGCPTHHPIPVPSSLPASALHKSDRNLFECGAHWGDGTRPRSLGPSR